MKPPAPSKHQILKQVASVDVGAEVGGGEEGDAYVLR